MESQLRSQNRRAADRRRAEAARRTLEAEANRASLTIHTSHSDVYDPETGMYGLVFRVTNSGKRTALNFASVNVKWCASFGAGPNRSTEVAIVELVVEPGETRSYRAELGAPFLEFDSRARRCGYDVKLKLPRWNGE